MMLSLNYALEGDENMHRTAGPNNIWWHELISIKYPQNYVLEKFQATP